MKFAEWTAEQFHVTTSEIQALRLDHALEILVCRLEVARGLGSSDPLITISPKRAGGNSRQVTRRMLAQLEYTRAQLRVIHRLLAGSTGGWPGLLVLYAARAEATPEQRAYVRRQVQLFHQGAGDPDDSAQPGPTRTGSSPGWVNKDWTP